MENNKRPNRHSNPSKQGIRRGGRFIFCRKKNREVKAVLKEMVA